MLNQQVGFHNTNHTGMDDVIMSSMAYWLRETFGLPIDIYPVPDLLTPVMRANILQGYDQLNN